MGSAPGCLVDGSGGLGPSSPSPPPGLKWLVAGGGGWVLFNAASVPLGCGEDCAWGPRAGGWMGGPPSDGGRRLMGGLPSEGGPRPLGCCTVPGPSEGGLLGNGPSEGARVYGPSDGGRVCAPSDAGTLPIRTSEGGPRPPRNCCRPPTSELRPLCSKERPAHRACAALIRRSSTPCHAACSHCPPGPIAAAAAAAADAGSSILISEPIPNEVMEARLSHFSRGGCPWRKAPLPPAPPPLAHGRADMLLLSVICGLLKEEGWVAGGRARRPGERSSCGWEGRRLLGRPGDADSRRSMLGCGAARGGDPSLLSPAS